MAALERVLMPEFTLTLSNGEVSTRADEINELRSRKVNYDVFENYDMLARLNGNDTVVILGKTRVKGTADGKSFDRVVQFTDTLIKRDGRWQLAAGIFYGCRGSNEESSNDVPADDIRRRFARSIQHLLDDYMLLANRWALWDNSIPPAKLLANSATDSIVDLRNFFVQQ
jgi:hypothetical protein